MGRESRRDLEERYWYIRVRDGTRDGPYTLKELCDKIAKAITLVINEMIDKSREKKRLAALKKKLILH